MFGALTKEKSKAMAIQMKILDIYLGTIMRRALRISKKNYDYCSKHEIIHTGMSLKQLSPKFMTIIDDFRGKK